MNRFELNKIIAAITLTVVIVFGIDKLADVIYKVEKPKSASYKIASSTQEINTETKNADLSGDIKSLLAQGSCLHLHG